MTNNQNWKVNRRPPHLAWRWGGVGSRTGKEEFPERRERASSRVSGKGSLQATAHSCSLLSQARHILKDRISPSAGHSLALAASGRHFCKEPEVGRKHLNFCTSGREPPGCGRVRKTENLLINTFVIPAARNPSVLQSPGLPRDGKCQFWSVASRGLY